MHYATIHGYKCIVKKKQYENKRTALVLTIEETGEPYVVATTNLPSLGLAKDEVVIKNYSENEGILKTLVDAKIISEPIAYAATGHVNSPICKLLI